ncbi:MAG: choice-of-anchor R domain-containing protein [Phycisphaerales bacterium]
MSHVHLVSLLQSVALLCPSLPAAGAEPLIDNLREPLRANTLIFDDGSRNLWAAQSFSADGRRYRLDSIETILGTATGRPVVVAELRDGDDPTGALLSTLSLPALQTAGTALVTLTPDADVIIEPGQAFTLILGVSNTADYEWAYANTNNWIGPGTFGNYHYSSDAGQTWANFGSKFPYYLRVNVTLICDPDCNSDGALSVADFGCFQGKYVLGDPYADCNGSGTLTVADFGCFQGLYVLGCP